MITKLGEVQLLKSWMLLQLRLSNGGLHEKTADKHKIKWQPEILTAGGTDTAGIQRMVEGGSIAGAVSIPTVICIKLLKWQ